MKPLEKNEVYQNLSGFLRTRGIELKEGSYAQAIQKSCSFLTQAINLSQESFERAKVEFDKNLDHLRQVVHEKTAPNPPRAPGAPQAKASSPKGKAPKRPAAKPTKKKTTKARK